MTNNFWTHRASHEFILWLDIILRGEGDWFTRLVSTHSHNWRKRCCNLARLGNCSCCLRSRCSWTIYSDPYVCQSARELCCRYTCLFPSARCRSLKTEYIYTVEYVIPSTFNWTTIISLKKTIIKQLHNKSIKKSICQLIDKTTFSLNRLVSNYRIDEENGTLFEQTDLHRAASIDLLSASSLEKSQVGIMAVQAACWTLHSSRLSSSSGRLLQLLSTSRERSFTPGPQLELQGDHIDHSVYRSRGHFYN